MPEEQPLHNEAKEVQKRKAESAKAAPARKRSAPRDVGVDVKAPQKECSDPKCPFHGTLPVRGHRIEGVVASAKMMSTIVVKREYLHFIKKYERFEKRTGRYMAHKPPCIDVEPGDHVLIMECRPISKAVSYVVLEKR